MAVGKSDLGVLGDLAVALGIFTPGGSPNPDWFGHPEASLTSMLSNPAQRAALIAFVDRALGGADRTTEAGVTWLPLFDIEDPPLGIALTVDEAQPDGLHIGIGMRVRTTAPSSSTTLAVPLFRVGKDGGAAVTQPLLLGSVGGRIRIGTSITLDTSPVVPGAARLGGIGIDIDLPTAPSDPQQPLFGLSLTGLQLPGATTAKDLRVAADGAGALDDAVLELVLGLVKAQADAALANSPIAALGGLLGLRSGDAVPDFPITELPVRGPIALADWVRGILTQPAGRADWLGYVASLMGGTRVDETVAFALGSAKLTLRLVLDTGPSGNARLAPTIGVELGDSNARVEANAALFRIDLVTGEAFALPSLALWAAAGRPGAGNRVLDVAAPTVARADTLRLGFAIDTARRLNFVLAADGVQLGTHSYPTLDLTSPDAVMDAVGNTVSDIASQLLAGLGDALGIAQQLLGLDPPAGVTAVTLPALMANPVDAVAGYWQQLIATPASASEVLGELRSAIADASEAVSGVQGSGTADDPWRLALIGPLQLEVSADGPKLNAGLAATTSVDTLGERCTVITTRFAARLATLDFAARSAQLLPGVEAVLAGRERGVNPPRARLPLGGGAALRADHVGLRLAWSPSSRLTAEVSAPNLTLETEGFDVPVVLPVVAADGNVTLPPEAWDAVEALVGHLAEITGGLLARVVAALGWEPELAFAGGDAFTSARLRLADFVADPQAALSAWLPRMLQSDVGREALDLLADMFGGAAAGSGSFARGFVEGTGHPDDPYRFVLAPELPYVAVWFPPDGLAPRLFAAPENLRAWRPGFDGLSPGALAAALAAEAAVARDVRELIEGRDIEGGLIALAQRWLGGDGRIVVPPSAPAGVTLRTRGVGAEQLLLELDVARTLGRTPAITVHVALGADAWPAARPERRVDLIAPGLAAAMFAAPAPDSGDWFVCLGTRADCRAATSSTDGTPEQAARLARVLDALATVSDDIALVAYAGAGHSARVAAEAQPAVRDLLLLGTPLSAISLSALSIQPTADALRLLQRLLPPVDAAEPDDPDLGLGRALVNALMELAPLADPAADLRPPVIAPPDPRAGLAVTALFGEVADVQIARAMTAIVASGLARRAQLRADSPPGRPAGASAGLRFVLPANTTGTVAITGRATLALFQFDDAAGARTDRTLRIELRIADRIGWLAATSDLELRAISAHLALPLDGAAAGSARIVLHDARVFGQSFERLVIGNAPDAVAVLPEARVLLAAGVQRVTADLQGSASLAFANLLNALGLTATNGSVIATAVDQLAFDPAGLVRERLAAARAQIEAAIASLLGPLASGIDLGARRVRVQGGGAASGRFGWTADATATLDAPAPALSGTVTIGPDGPLPMVGSLQLRCTFTPGAPPSLALHWHTPGSNTADVASLWPHPDASAAIRMLTTAAPSLAAHVALELMRRADDAARPVIDAVLDALGMLAGIAGDEERALRPLAGLLADPAGWLRSEGSVAASPLKIQHLFDALRPLLGVAGSPGDPLALATGVSLAVSAEGTGARLSLAVDPTLWTAAQGVTARLSAGVAASLGVSTNAAPSAGLEVFLGAPGPGVAAGRRAVHARIGAHGLEVFARPTTGADIALVPFAGLGSLAAAAEAALPFLLDKLAGIAGPVGNVVQGIGDALGLRSGNPRRFDSAALHAWAVNPSGALTLALPSVASTGLATLAPLVDAFVPASVDVTANANALTVTASGVSLAWNPSSGVVTVHAANLAAPGVNRLGFTVALGAAGLNELSVMAGPAEIDAGGVTIRPFVAVGAGIAPAGGRRLAVGLAVDDTHRFGARWSLDGGTFALTASDGTLAAAVETVDPMQVALRAVEVVADLVAAVAMAQAQVQALLAAQIGALPANNVRALLRGVLLADAPNPTALIAGVFDPSTLLSRVHRLFVNLAASDIEVDLGDVRIAFAKGGAGNTVVGLRVSIGDRFQLIKSDVCLWLENDDRWISPAPGGPGGVFVGFLPDTLPLAFKPLLVVEGLGLRIGKSSGPLLDAGLTLESIALHAFAEIDPAASQPFQGAGVQIEFSGLAVGATGGGGSNGIAQGVMRDTGPTPPKPAFSPALAIQKHGSGPVAVTLSAGDGAGPWWIAIQKGFGPLYLEQIGFGATMPNGRVERVSLLMDGSVSMFGLTCAVDDLQITYLVSNGDFFDPHNWAVDLAGLAVSANMAGVTLAGGLLKQSGPQGIEYLGMLLGRFAVYGLTVYGGYGEGVDAKGQKFTAFFAVGAINGPIGGPPAFFLTGIGGGFGINRKLVVPSDLSNFGNYPLIQALDIAAKPVDPMAQLRQLGQYFPMNKGTFWFAAGLSFNSFALVDGIAVVGVQVGDGLDINLLGLARMALPRPQVALVSIEVALLVRFSSSEGVLWVQGQLTDNSWLLYPDVKLTGGFAYVIWFKGEHAGEFVFTLGGFHPDFHRDGYPVVPRLGLRWSIGNTITIKAGTYFALTSEALMAGGDFEASASLGPAWVEVKFGAHGIVYFDPFHYDVQAYARIAAGVTIDTWLFGEITFHVSLGARIHVEGPDFRGSVTFEVGPIELTFRFGGDDKAQIEPISGPAFIAKYLDAADSGKARPHGVMTNAGTLPSKGEESTPDGSSSRPFVVVVEFSITLTSTVPATGVRRVGAPAAITFTSHPPSRALGVAPRNVANVTPEIRLTWLRGGVPQAYPFVDRARPFGRFPVGVWGLPQDPSNRKIPKGEMIEALNELDLACVALPSAGGPEIPYYQVEIGKRRPLPFTRKDADVSKLRTQAGAVTALVAPPANVAAAFAAASRFLGKSASPTALAALRGERQAPPLTGTLTEGLETATATVVPSTGDTPPARVYDHFIDAPVAVGRLSAATVGLAATPGRGAGGTTVKGSEKAWRVAPPTLAKVDAERSRSIAARLVLMDDPAMRFGGVSTGTTVSLPAIGTLIAARSVPPSAVGHGATAVVARSGAGLVTPLTEFSSALVAPAQRSPGSRAAAAGKRRRARSASRDTAAGGAALPAGDTVVLQMPNADADAAVDVTRPQLAVANAPARVVLLGHGGQRLADRLVGPGSVERIDIVRGTQRIVAIGQGAAASLASRRNTAATSGLSGWHAGTQMPYAGNAVAVGPGVVVHASGEPLTLHRERRDAGWVSGAELARGVSTVTTTFTEPAQCVLIALDDPAALGDPVDGRQLLLGLDGAARAQDATGGDRAPVLLTMDNRSVLAYDILPAAPDANGARAPVVVTIASQRGWALVGVMGSVDLDAASAIVLVAARGLDAALQPLAPTDAATVPPASVLTWIGPVRNATERQRAKGRAAARRVPEPA